MSETTPIPNVEYWSAIVQVLPVILLAVVVEARAISVRWTRREPQWYKIVQSVLWAALLIATAVGELLAIRVLLGDVQEPWWTAMSSTTAIYGILLLAVAPALQTLARGFAEPIAAIVTLHPKESLRLWRMRREAQAALDELLQLEAEIRADLRRQRSHLAEIEADRETFVAAAADVDHAALTDEQAAAVETFRRNLIAIDRGIADERNMIARGESRAVATYERYLARKARLDQIREAIHAAMRANRATQREIIAQLLLHSQEPPSPS